VVSRRRARRPPDVGAELERLRGLAAELTSQIAARPAGDDGLADRVETLASGIRALEARVGPRNGRA
jgi:hypothetical protein